MEMRNAQIDSGNPFDWGRTSADYAKYRDIYPNIFYEKIVARNLCTRGQRVLDLGTGTGVLPRNLYRYGAQWVGVDRSEEQIAQARQLSAQLHQNIEYQAVSAEDVAFADHTFDVITACQCFWYFDPEKVVPKLARMLKDDGTLLLLYMAWLPFEDNIAGASEALVRNYNPSWSGAGEVMHPIEVPERVYDFFQAVCHEEYQVDVPFTRETWNGRMKACRGVGASLPPAQLAAWEREHQSLLAAIAPEAFFIKHYAALLALKRK